MGRERSMVCRSVAVAMALLCLAVSASTDMPSIDSDVIDDLGIDAMADPGQDGELIHEDSAHMSEQDVRQASDVFDTLYPTEEDGDLGEGASIGNPLEDARKARKAATKNLLAAKGASATKKAESALKKAEQAVEGAKMSVLGKDGVNKEKRRKVAEELNQAKAEEAKARSKVLSAKGLKATEKAKAKVKKDKREAAALGMKEGKTSSKSAMKKTIFEAKVAKKVKAAKNFDKYEKRVMNKANQAMKEFLPKSSTYIKSDGNNPVMVKIFPGSKNAQEAPESGSKAEAKMVKKQLAEAEDLRKAAQSALVKAKSKSEKRAAEEVLKKADKKVQKARLALAIVKSGKRKGNAKQGLASARIKAAQKAAKQAQLAAKEKKLKSRKAAKLAKKHARKVKEMMHKKIRESRRKSDIVKEK